MRISFVFFIAALVASGCAGAAKKEAPKVDTTQCKGDFAGCLKRAQAIIKESPHKCDSAVPLLDEACAAKNPQACVILGRAHQTKVISNPSAEAALKYFSSACELADGDGCRFAAFALLGRDDKEKMKKGASLLETTCSKGRADSCVSLAAAASDLEELLGKKLNPLELSKKAETLYEAECAKNDGGSCRSLGELLTKGSSGKQDLEKAADYFRKGCELRDGKSCAMAAHVYESGKGALPDIENAELMYRNSCELGDPRGCALLGIFLRERGKMDDAIDFYKKSCDSWDGLGCYELAVTYNNGANVPENKNTAFDYYLKSCDFQYPGGCNNLGRMYQLGEGTEQDYGKALGLYSKVCQGLTWDRDPSTFAIQASACNNLGAVYAEGLGVQPNLQTAYKYFSKGCKHGDQAACYNKQNIDKQFNATSRFDVLKQCSQGSAKSCYELGMMWGAGEDGPKDLKQAKHWVKIACDNGYKEACAILPSMREEERKKP